jgi:hypothetical protein
MIHQSTPTPQHLLHRTFLVATKSWCPQQESNLYLILRRNLFYPLNYRDKDWCHELDSNQPHTDFQSAALPDELPRHCLAEAVRFELTDPLESLVFKTSAIGHSTTLPKIDLSIVQMLIGLLPRRLPRPRQHCCQHCR